MISGGFAGGLDPELATADLVIAENLSTPEVLARVRSRTPPTPRCRFGAVVSRAETIETVAAKAGLHRETGALAVDMESETVAVACRAAGVPLLVVRTISDAADAPLPVPFAEWFDLQRQVPRKFGLVKHLLFHPGRIGPFAGFVRGLAPARRTLAEFLLRFLTDFDSQTLTFEQNAASELMPNPLPPFIELPRQDANLRQDHAMLFWVDFRQIRSVRIRLPLKSMPPDLRQLYDEHASALFAFLLNFTRREADARDVLQELFLKLSTRPRHGWLAKVRANPRVSPSSRTSPGDRRPSPPEQLSESRSSPARRLGTV